MQLKPQDFVVLLKLALTEKEPWSYASLGLSLGLSPSEVHGAVKRLIVAGLLHPQRRQANVTALEEMLVHGVKYFFPVERGRLTRGMPTAHAAPPLVNELIADDDPPPVWPDPEGTVRGETFEPLYPSVPRAARNDTRLYQALALVDAIRGGRTRERKLAAGKLHEMLAQ